MAATAAKIGSGILLKIGDGAGTEVFTKVAELKALGPFKFTRETPEATHTESPNSYREYIAGLKDGGEVTAECNFVSDAAMTTFLTDFEAGTLRNFKIEFPNTVVFAFAGIITEWGPSAIDIKAPMQRGVKIKVSGKVTVS